jgi:hypothetical protein
LHSPTLGPALLAGLLAAALASGAATGAGAPASSLPFINGGITSEEAEAIRQEAPRYPLEITMARRNPEVPGYNDFVADAQLRVIDSAGRVVLERPDIGPIFLASLPDGTYTLEATYNGETKTQRVRVSSGRHAAVTFLWQ